MRGSPKLVFLSGALTGILAMSVLQGTGSRAEPPAKASAPALKVDDAKMATTYINAYRIFTTQEEAVVDLGFNMADTDAPNGNSGGLVFTVSNRVIMSYSTAKRLRTSLDTLIKRYEDKFGEISTTPKANP